MLSHRLFAASQNSGSILSLVYRGRGRVTNNSGSVTLNYSTVDGGSAPSAGDLVIYTLFSFSGASISTPSGWTLLGSLSGTYVHACYAKILTASDISSPPTPLGGTGEMGTWVAATPSVSATIDSTSFVATSEGNTNPSPVSSDESSSVTPGVIVSTHQSTNTTSITSPSWSGATEDGSLTANFTLKINNAMETLYKVYPSSGSTGENISADMGDSGNANYQAIMAVWLTAA